MSSPPPSPQPFPLDIPETGALGHGLDEAVANILAAAAASPRPLFVHMLGVPGSGKSSCARVIHAEMEPRWPGGVTLLGFDGLMQQIGDYRALDDRAAAFARFEMPARTAGYALLRGLLDRRASIIFDHGGAAPGHPDILRHARTLGYAACVVQLACPLPVAAARIARRTGEEGRHTPGHYLAEREKLIAELASDYAGLADRFFVIDNGPLSAPDLAARARDVAAQILAEHASPSDREPEPI